MSSVDSLMYKSLFDLLFFTGIRKGELLALTWDDIDFDLGSIYISKNLSKSVVNGSHLITTPKTRSSIRNIVIDNVILNELKDLHNYYKSNYIDFSSSWFLFGGIIEIDAVAGQELRALALQGADTAIAVDGDAPRAVTHLGGHTAY